MGRCQALKKYKSPFVGIEMCKRRLLYGPDFKVGNLFTFYVNNLGIGVIILIVRKRILMPIWNPWHGCHKISAGCKFCYMFRGDEQRGAIHPSDEVHKTRMFNLPIKRDRKAEWKFPSGTHFWLCFTSDLLIEEADEWRQEIWSMIRLRSDCRFTFLTKRIERLPLCLPDDWGLGYDNVTIGCTVENQDRADFRLPVFLDIPVKHRCIMAEPLLESIDIEAYLRTGLVEFVSVGGESGVNVRPLNFEWVKALYMQSLHADVEFSFHQTGANFVKDGRLYHIPRKFQHSQAEKAMSLLRKMF